MTEQLTLTLKVTKPWWWAPVAWTEAILIGIRYLFSDGPPEEVCDAFIRKWSRRIRIAVV